jgi:hypothetical protein
MAGQPALRSNRSQLASKTVLLLSGTNCSLGQVKKFDAVPLRTKTSRYTFSSKAVDMEKEDSSGFAGFVVDFAAEPLATRRPASNASWTFACGKTARYRQNKLSSSKRGIRAVDRGFAHFGVVWCCNGENL